MSLFNVQTEAINFKTYDAFLAAYRGPIREALALLPYIGERLADDVTDSLFVKIWEKDTLSKKPDGGRFRDWLYVVARHHAQDELRKIKRRRETSGRFETDLAADPRESAPGDEPFDSDELYALSVLHMTVARVRKHLMEEGMAEHWLIFEELHLAPIIPGRLAKTREQLLTMFPGHTPTTLTNRATTVKRVFKSMLPALIPADPTDSLTPEARFQEFQDILRASKNTRLWLAFLSDPVTDSNVSVGTSLDFIAPSAGDRGPEPLHVSEDLSDELKILLGFWLEKPLQDYIKDMESVGDVVAEAMDTSSRERRRGPVPYGARSLNLRTLIDDSSPIARTMPPAELTELSRRVKSFVKIVHATAQANRATDRYVPAYRWESSLPVEVLQVLYNLAAALAFLRAGTRISGLDDIQYRKNIKWVLSQPWLDARLRPVFYAAMTKLGAGKKEAGANA